jgi:hypothetical protein
MSVTAAVSLTTTTDVEITEMTAARRKLIATPTNTTRRTTARVVQLTRTCAVTTTAKMKAVGTIVAIAYMMALVGAVAAIADLWARTAVIAMMKAVGTTVASTDLWTRRSVAAIMKVVEDLTAVGRAVGTPVAVAEDLTAAGRAIGTSVAAEPATAMMKAVGTPVAETATAMMKTKGATVTIAETKPTFHCICRGEDSSRICSHS